MRIVHTSDWHLGQRFLGESREVEHRLFLQWLLKIIDDSTIDALVVSGDIFDTATPPSYARKLYNDFLAKAYKTECKNIIIVGGNHDSPAVLNEQKALFKGLNIFVIGGYENPEEIAILIKDENGNPKGVIGAVAYIRESDIRDSSNSTDTKNREKALEMGIKNYYWKLFNQSKRLLDGRDLPIVATGHLSVIKNIKSEAMRDIYIGSLEVFNKDNFPPFDYIALGHYHKFIQMKNICYSGSPIPLSFDEINRKKVVLDVNILPQSSDLDIKIVEVPTFRKLHRVKGDIETVKRCLSNIQTNGLIPNWAEIEIIQEEGLYSFSETIEELKRVNKSVKY